VLNDDKVMNDETATTKSEESAKEGPDDDETEIMQGMLKATRIGVGIVHASFEAEEGVP
jgi:hypothetical protein